MASDISSRTTPTRTTSPTGPCRTRRQVPQGVASERFDGGRRGGQPHKGDILAANIWNQPGDEAYPIASFTYLIVYKDLNNVQSKEQAQALRDFLWWAEHDGQKFASELDYAPLAPGVQKKVEAALESVNFHGQSIAQR